MTLDTITLRELAPESIAGERMEVIDLLLRATAAEVELPTVMHNLGRLTSEQLDHVAAWFDAPTWNSTWDIQLKRSVIMSTIETKRHQGTLYAVKTALASVGAACRVTEWWQTEPRGEPHTFTIEVTLSGTDSVTEELQTIVQMLIDAAKPVRSHYTFRITTSISGGKGAEAVMRGITEARLTTY